MNRAPETEQSASMHGALYDWAYGGQTLCEESAVVAEAVIEVVVGGVGHVAQTWPCSNALMMGWINRMFFGSLEENSAGARSWTATCQMIGWTCPLCWKSHSHHACLR